MQTEHHLLAKGMFQSVLPHRDMDAHKGSSGSVAIIGGDSGMLGAVLLASRTALLMGAGRVYAAMLSQQAPVVDVMHPEIMMRSPSDLATLAQLNCVAIGPGLGQSPLALELLDFWLSQEISIVLDADALNLIAKHTDLADRISRRKLEAVITPHVGEAARLLESSVQDIQKSRVEAAQALARMFRVTCVLKGAGTVIAQHDGRYFINTSGNPALATAGTGDVLTGAIAGLIAQGLASIDAAKLGVYAHGDAADRLVAGGIGPLGVTASEFALEMRYVINQLNRANL